MGELRFRFAWLHGSGLLLGGVALCLMAGCGGGGGDEDAGVDSGIVLRDSGQGTDSGPTPGADAGGGGTDSGSASTCGPPPPPDGGAWPCTLTDASSCPMAGQACVFRGSSDTSWELSCFPSGVQGAGQPCDPSMSSLCQEGFQCNDGTCQKICCSATDCEAGQFCTMIAGLNAGLCDSSDDCDIYETDTTMDGCPDRQGCYVADPSGSVACSMEGTATEGMECMFTNGCVAGHGCYGGNCRQTCDPADPMCPDGFTCRQISDPDTGPIPGAGGCFPD